MIYNIDRYIDVKEPRKLYNKENYVKEPSKTGFCTRKFTEFCKRTDLHGYKYIVMEDLSVAERSFWAIAVLASLLIAIYFVVTAYKWYARNPIVTVIESTQGAIWDVPFPAVTICDLNLISRKAARAFANNVTLPDNVNADFVFETVRLAPLLHSTYILNNNQKRDLYKLQSVLDLNNISLEQLFRQLSPVTSCSRLVEKCMWKNTVYRCDQLFQQVFTMQNLCCAFNYYALTNPDNKFISRTRSSFSRAPRRVASCGYQTALTVLVRTDPDDYYSAFVASQGALVFIDDAYNVPDVDSPVRFMNPSTEVMIALSPERTYSTPGVRAFSPEQRQCYYYDEVTIKNFKQYSFHNCVTIRKVEILRKACSCVPFYYEMKESRSCNFMDIDCLENILRLDEFQTNGNFVSTQKCLPECEHFNYHFEVALGALSNNIKINGHPFFNNVDLVNRSLLNVFFNDLVSTKYRRDVYLNWQNILAAFGGLLSLMLGFTLISGFDLVLYFTFRVAYDFINSVVRRTRKSSLTYVNNAGYTRNKTRHQKLYVKNSWLEDNLNSNINSEISRRNFGKW